MTRLYEDEPPALLPLAIDAVRAQHYDALAIDERHGAFIALRDHEAMLVRIFHAMACGGRRRVVGACRETTIVVSPVEPDEQRRGDAEALLLGIYDRTRSLREASFK